MTVPSPPGQPALAGLRVTDFCWWGVGAIGTRLLADFGAEVWKIEWPGRIDYTRQLPPVPSRTMFIPGEISGAGDPNLSGYFHNHNRNKRSVCIDMKTERGQQLIRDLISVSDLVTENFRPGVMNRWGLDFEHLQQLNPRVVFVSTSGHGQSGPDALFGTNGPVVQALSGLTASAGLPGRPPSGYGYSYMDQTAGYFSSIGALLGLYRRGRVGSAQRVEVSSVEVGINLLNAGLLAASAHADAPDIVDGIGNRDIAGRSSPHGVFPSDTEDRWVAIAVSTDDQWRSLRAVMGDPAWAVDARFETRAGRYVHQEEIEEQIAAWTRGQDRYVLMQRLQAVSVAAGVVQNSEDKARRDPQLRVRNTFPVVEHDQIGPWPVQGVPFTLSDSPSVFPATGGPLLGRDTRDVLTNVLGLSGDDVDKLVSEEVVYCDDSDR
jgi:crotonobetainyl-CoA:carnitine CoA-transferase CaiB-like acyl-CoA transferase